MDYGSYETESTVASESVRSRAEQAAALERPDVDDCSKCAAMLLDDFLWRNYALPVCDDCRCVCYWENQKGVNAHSIRGTMNSSYRDSDYEHKLVSRTAAKEEFLLKDEDLDLRKPPLP